RQQRPGVRFYVAGMKPPESFVRWLKQHPDIIVVPDPEDMRPWIARGTVFVCPILDGGGTKLKILDAMGMGKAVIGTSIACEGIDVNSGENVLIADAPQDLADTIRLALNNKSMRERLGAAGRILIEERYSWDVIGKRLDRAFRCG